jgi:hypothetical protein
VLNFDAWIAHESRKLLDVFQHSPGTTFANMHGNMDGVVATLIVVTSIGLSIGVSRLAVGEMFRLVRMDMPRRREEPPTA